MFYSGCFMHVLLKSKCDAVLSSLFLSTGSQIQVQNKFTWNLSATDPPFLEKPCRGHFRTSWLRHAERTSINAVSAFWAWIDWQRKIQIRHGHTCHAEQSRGAVADCNACHDPCRHGALAPQTLSSADSGDRIQQGAKILCSMNAMLRC